MEMSDRIAKLEGKQEGLDVFLPRMLARFEHMEVEVQRARREQDRAITEMRESMEAGFADIRRNIDQDRNQRVSVIIALASIFVAVLAVAAAIYFD